MMLSQISKNKLQPNNWQFDAIGTKWTIETTRPLDALIRSEISDCIERFDHAYSRFRDDSIVSRMAKDAGLFDMPAENVEISLLYAKLYIATEGAMTPLIGDSLVSGGYDKNYSFTPSAPLSAENWNEVLEWKDTFALTKKAITLDIGAAGKGKLVDMIAQMMQAFQITSFVIDASGDICHRGSDVQTIGLEDPADPTRVLGTIPLTNASLCASAVNRRRWGKAWHHVIDGRTGRPVDDISATWVLAPTTMEADGLATALFFVDAATLAHIADFQFVRLFKDGRVEHSRDFVGQLYI